MNPELARIAKELSELKAAREKAVRFRDFYDAKLRENGIRPEEHKALMLFAGKPYSYWIQAYDSRISRLESQRDSLEYKERLEKTAIYALPLIALLLIAIFIGRPLITGMVAGPGNSGTIIVGEVFDAPAFYNFTADGNLTSLRISGEIIGEGSVRVYLGNLLVLDSSFLGQGGNEITGLVVGDMADPSEIIGASSEDNPVGSIVDIEEDTADIAADDTEADGIAEVDNTADVDGIAEVDGTADVDDIEDAAGMVTDSTEDTATFPPDDEPVDSSEGLTEGADTSDAEGAGLVEDDAEDTDEEVA